MRILPGDHTAKPFQAGGSRWRERQPATGALGRFLLAELAGMRSPRSACRARGGVADGNGGNPVVAEESRDFGHGVVGWAVVTLLVMRSVAISDICASYRAARLRACPSDIPIQGERSRGKWTSPAPLDHAHLDGFGFGAVNLRRPSHTGPHAVNRGKLAYPGQLWITFDLQPSGAVTFLFLLLETNG